VTANDLREIGVGMLGYMTWPPPLRPRLVAIAGRNEEAVAEAARRYGFDRWTTQWEELVADPEIGLVDNLGPNDLHAAPTIAAARAGKHVVCEKPLGRDADESYEIWRRVAATGVKHMCAFNYRFVPAVRLAREMIDAGELGELRHFRGRYLQDWGDTTERVWRFDRGAAGSGALGDLAAHVVDLLRHPAKAEQLARAARALAEEKYSWESRAHGYEQLYAAVIAQRKVAVGPDAVATAGRRSRKRLDSAVARRSV